MRPLAPSGTPGYNPRAYVPGGAPLNVAKAIQAKGWGLRPPTVKPPVSPSPKPAGDPLWNSVNAQIMGMVSPLLTQLANQRALAEANARKVYGLHAGALESALTASSAPIIQSFDTGIASSAAVNDAVANRLNSQGGEAQESLAGKLAQISADPAAATEIAKTYSGASNAGFASGAADLQDLISQRAQAGAYQGKLPGFARLESSRDLAQALSEQRSEFGQRENELITGAQENAFNLWNQQRQEKAQAASAKEQALISAVSDAEERAWKQNQTLIALRATAQNKAQERAFTAQIEAANRRSKEEIAAANRAYNAWKVQQGQAFTGAENEANRSATAAQKAADRKAATERARIAAQNKPKPGAPKPLSGAQSGVVRNEIMKQLVNSQGRIRVRYTAGGTPDRAIGAEINRMFDARKVPKSERQALRRIIFAQINGRRTEQRQDGKFGVYRSPEWGLK